MLRITNLKRLLHSDDFGENFAPFNSMPKQQKNKQTGKAHANIIIQAQTASKKYQGLFV